MNVLEQFNIGIDDLVAVALILLVVLSFVLMPLIAG